MNNPGFNEAFVEMVSRLTQMENTAVEGLGGAADEICSLLRIAYLDVTQYQNHRAEMQNDGRSLVYYNTQQPRGEAFASFRNVADNRTIVFYRAFPEKDAAPWSENEQKSIDLLLRTIFHFNSRSNLLQIINRFTYYDPYGFRNLRCFMRYLWEMSEQGKLPGMNSYMMDLKHFGLINQQIGRKRGDLVLHKFYNGLQNLIGDGGLVCRMGGDRFIMLAEKQLMPDILHYLSGTGIVYDERTNESAQTRRNVMFRYVISMAQELGLQCITEGVETAEQVSMLANSHCEMAQGFFFDKPLPVAEFEKRLEQMHYA